MKSLKIGALTAVLVSAITTQVYAGSAEASPQNIIKQALLGAGTGALSAELSGGKAGKGALIGAGTSVIGNSLFSVLFDSPSSRPVSYYAPRQAVQTYSQPMVIYQPSEPIYHVPGYSYTTAPQTDSNRIIIRQGLLGAGVGAISAEASGGKAGTGALVGAGTNIIGGALFDVLLNPQPKQSMYQIPATTSSRPLQKKIVRHFDASGKVVSEEEFYI